MLLHGSNVPTLEVLTRDVLLPIVTLGVSKVLEWRQKALQADRERERESGKPPPVTRQRLLLIVEDNALDVELLEYYLRQASRDAPDKYGVEIDVATQTDDGWTCYLKKQHDIVLVDMRFPTGEQGWTLAEKMRRHDLRTQIVIMYTVTADIDNLPSGQLFSFMRKPPTYEGILQLLTKLKSVD